MKINMMQLTKFISWSVIGDGYVGFSTHNKNAHYSVQRDPIHKDYIEMVASKFEGLQDCSVLIKEYVRKDNGKSVISLRTSSHPVFTRVRNRSYTENHRVIDPHYLKYLDFETASLWYMDDGSLCFNNKGYPIVRISSCAFSYYENEALRKKLLEKTGTIWNIQKNGQSFQLGLAKKSYDIWFSGIEPYILDSYKYKLPGFLKEETPRTGDDLV